MAHQITPRQQNGFQTAIEDLTDGLSRLVRQHFELARIEVRSEAKEVSRDVAIIVAAAAIALIGYIFLNLAIILTALWLGSVAAMAITSIIIAALHIIAAVLGVTIAIRRLKKTDMGLPQTTEELQRNKTWIKEIRENSSPSLSRESS